MIRFLVLAGLLVACVALPRPEEQEQQQEQQQEGQVKCGYSTCGANSDCVTSEEGGYKECKCKTGFYGSGYGSGCTSEPQCVDHSGCKDDEVCHENLCTSPCWRSCPADVGCLVRNHVAECIYGGRTFFDPPEGEADPAPLQD